MRAIYATEVGGAIAAVIGCRVTAGPQGVLLAIVNGCEKAREFGEARRTQPESFTSVEPVLRSIFFVDLIPFSSFYFSAVGDAVASQTARGFRSGMGRDREAGL